MAQREPSAAQALYGHLPSASRPERQQRGPGLAASMWPSQTPEAKARDAFAKRNRDNLLRGLKELNAKMREGRR